jgi:hypothetical protein
LENPNVIFLLPMLLSISFLLRYHKHKHFSSLLVSSILGVVQIYLAPIGFVFWLIIWSSFMLYFFFLSGTAYVKPISLFGIAGLLLLLISPYLYFYVLSDNIAHYYNPVQKETIWLLSLSVDDFFRALPGNLLYGQGFGIQPYFNHIKAANLGVVFWMSTFAGIFLMRDERRWLFAFFICLGVVLSLGPVVNFENKALFPAPLWPFYEYLNMTNLFRAPSRFFFIAVLFVSMSTAFAWYHLWMQLKHGKMLCAGLFLILLVENIPFKFPIKEDSTLIHPDEVIFKLADFAPGSIHVAHLPSALFVSGGDLREYTYVYWQHIHRQNILNGGSAFFSPERMRNNEWMSRYNEADHLSKLIDSNQLNFIIWHTEFEAAPPLSDYDKRLSLYATSARCLLYEVRRME